MNHKPSKLRQTDKQEAISEEQQQQESKVQEFSSVEDLLRHDADKTVVPSGIATKLNESIAKTPAPEARSWWARFFSREQ